MSLRRSVILTALCGLLLSACGGGSSGGSSNQQFAGIWTGDWPLSENDPFGGTVGGYFNPDGSFLLYRQDGTTFRGLLNVSGTSANGTFEVILTRTGELPDGATTGSGTLQLERLAGDVISGEFSIVTGLGNEIRGDITLSSLEEEYRQPASAALAAGTYWKIPSRGESSFTLETTLFEVASDGTLTLLFHATTGCVASGRLTVPNPAVNVYLIELEFDLCSGGRAALNGVELSGRASLTSVELSSGATSLLLFGMLVGEVNDRPTAVPFTMLEPD